MPTRAESTMNAQPVNDTEQFVFNVCRRTFLSLWCYNNPIWKPGKELCDVLVVCDPHVIIISVKSCKLKSEDPTRIECNRWTKKAVDESINQIYGAERRLQTESFVLLGDGSPGIKLPSLDQRKVHRIAVAFGSSGWVPIPSMDFGKGFVHVLTENGFLEILNELDTITDLIEYLVDKEVFLTETSVIVDGGEQNLLGLYLLNERAFPIGPDMAVIDDTLWNAYVKRPEVLRKKTADRDSYSWDWLINELSSPLPDLTQSKNWELSNIELVLRMMAQERRFDRRILSKSLTEFLTQYKEKKLRARVLQSYSEVIYVIVCFSANEIAEERSAELMHRCYIARHTVGTGNIVIGIGFGEHILGKGSASDLVYLNLPGWCDSDDAIAEELKADTGYFENATLRHEQEEEYPD